MIPFTGTEAEWNELVVSLPLAGIPQQSHYMQTWQWAQAKSRTGWQPIPFYWEDNTGNPVAAAMVLKRPLPVRGLSRRVCVLFVPRGPVLDWENRELISRVLNDLEAFSKKQGAVYIKIDPDVTLGTGAPGEGAVEYAGQQFVCPYMHYRDWKYSKEQVLILNTILVDLNASEDEMLARMKQKTRYNIRLAQKKGVKVRLGTIEDQDVMYRMLRETSERDHFGIRDEGHYRHLWQSWRQVNTHRKNQQPFVENWIAEVEGEIVAAITLFVWGEHATYLWGMSRAAHREKMPNYLLQWEAMRRAKTQGCTIYDTYGISDTFIEGSPLWSVYRFKEGFGGEVYRSIGAWDFTPRPMLYYFYMEVLPVIKKLFGLHGPPYIKTDSGNSISS